MAETLKIQIELSGSAGGQNGESQLAGMSGTQAKNNAKAFFTLDRGISVAKQFATQIVDAHVGMIGLSTGNYVLQERVQRSLNIGQKLIGIGVSFAINPILGTLNLISEGISMGVELARQNKEVAWQNRSANELARRAGYLADENRGRR